MFGGLLPKKQLEDEGIDETDSGSLKEGEKEEEVREHMADILLAKNKLSSLQKQVKGEREGEEGEPIYTHITIYTYINERLCMQTMAPPPTTSLLSWTTNP